MKIVGAKKIKVFYCAVAMVDYLTKHDREFYFSMEMTEAKRNHTNSKSAWTRSSLSVVG